MQCFVNQGVYGKIKFGIERIGDKFEQIAHVDGAMQLAIAAVEDGIIKNLFSNAAYIVPDTAIESNGIGTHLEVEVSEYRYEIVFILVGAEEFFG